MMVPIPQFAAPSYMDRMSSDLQTCRNLYPEKTATGYKLISWPGNYLLGTTANNLGCRNAFYTSTGQVFSVNGGVVYEVFVDGTSTSRGSLSLASGDVSFADNGTQAFIVQHGSNGYTMTLSAGAPTLIADANFPSAPQGATFIDGYFVTCKGQTGQFYLSQLYDGTDWTPIAFATAESMGDNLVNVKNIGNELWLFGARSIERWYNTGNQDFPFERINGAVYDMGLLAPMSLTVLDNSAYFMGSSQTGRNAAFSISSGGIKRLTTPALESLIGSFGGQGWFGYCFRYDGHSFYALDNRGSSGSYVYDIGENAWLDRCVQATTSPLRLVINAFTTNGQPPYAFDYSNGKIYHIKADYNTVDTARIRMFGPVGDGSKKVFHNRIRFVFEAAFDATPSTTFNFLSIQWTDDDGVSYSSSLTPSVTIVATTTGQLITVEARRLGSSARRFYKMTLSLAAQARFIFTGCYLDAQEGRF